jgi:hypothetical protein
MGFEQLILTFGQSAGRVHAAAHPRQRCRILWPRRYDPSVVHHHRRLGLANRRRRGRARQRQSRTGCWLAVQLPTARRAIEIHQSRGQALHASDRVKRVNKSGMATARQASGRLVVAMCVRVCAFCEAHTFTGSAIIGVCARVLLARQLPAARAKPHAPAILAGSALKASPLSCVTPDWPSRSRRQQFSAPTPNGVTSPMPVTTTRRAAPNSGGPRTRTAAAAAAEAPAAAIAIQGRLSAYRAGAVRLIELQGHSLAKTVREAARVSPIKARNVAKHADRARWNP